MKKIAALLIIAFVFGMLAFTGGTKVTVSCGPQVSTPLVMQGIDGAAASGKKLFDLSEHDPSLFDVARMTLGAWHTIGMWIRVFRARLNGEPIPADAVTIREEGIRLQKAALTSCCVTPNPSNPPPPSTPTPPPGQGFDPKSAALVTGTRFTAEQTSIARTAVQMADSRALPERAKLVILVTGFQESGVRNLPYGDRDSLGWLQQRDGWGTKAQRMNPAYAAGKFYDALVRVRGWQGMPLTRAAQAVQRSAFPKAYAQWEPKARSLLAAIGSTAPQAPLAAPPAYCPSPVGGGDATGKAAPGGGSVPSYFDRQGNPRTVEAAIAWMQRAAPRGASGEQVLNRCERYMNLAYGWPGGYATAAQHWTAPGERVVSMVIPPPRGALVFWSTGSDGHVALSLGNGRVISTDFDGTRYHAGMIAEGPIEAIDRWGPRLGWRAPSFRVST